MSLNGDEQEDLTNYQEFSQALKACTNMAKEYLSRCIIEGRVNTEDLYYFKNLFALQIDTYTNVARILCSNSPADCDNEATKSYNIRYITIDEDLFNKTSEEFDKGHLDQSLLILMKKLNKEQKSQLYDALRDILEPELNDMGGL